MSVTIRDFKPADAEALNSLALTVFSEYRDHYHDWPAMREEYSRMSELAQMGRIIVATENDAIVGGVAYIGPRTARLECLDPEWSFIRSLVVDPACRGRGTGTELTRVCIKKAVEDGSSAIALLTSPAMTHAVRIYEKLGFRKVSDLGKATGMHYFLYVKDL
jgi:ribosomal protein S18 acetylase RimI-like enzyme